MTRLDLPNKDSSAMGIDVDGKRIGFRGGKAFIATHSSQLTVTPQFKNDRRLWNGCYSV